MPLQGHKPENFVPCMMGQAMRGQVDNITLDPARGWVVDGKVDAFMGVIVGLPLQQASGKTQEQLLQLLQGEHPRPSYQLSQSTDPSWPARPATRSAGMPNPWPEDRAQARVWQRQVNTNVQKAAWLLPF